MCPRQKTSCRKNLPLSHFHFLKHQDIPERLHRIFSPDLRFHQCSGAPHHPYEEEDSIVFSFNVKPSSQTALHHHSQGPQLSLRYRKRSHPEQPHKHQLPLNLVSQEESISDLNIVIQLKMSSVPDIKDYINL